MNQPDESPSINWQGQTIKVCKECRQRPPAHEYWCSTIKKPELFKIVTGYPPEWDDLGIDPSEDLLKLGRLEDQLFKDPREE